jgi:hypothetical protein
MNKIIYREVFIIFHRLKGKIVNLEIGDQEVSHVSLKLSKEI